jgi:folate-binding Fe-S cluster repair protein YgfZ
MHHLQLQTPTLPSPGDSIQDSAGKAIGNIASAAQVDKTTVEILAVLADKAADVTEIQIGEGQLEKITHLPLPYEIPTGP